MRRISIVAFGLLTIVVVSLAPKVDGQGKKKTFPVDDARHDPAKAVANLDVHPELQATLFASEPKITNPTNLDIDHRGRVWICDVINYRGNNGKRPEGDRILILEDTDGDGKADRVKTFYQGRDIDSAMGICVLGNKVIVSASPNVFVFTFDDDDKVAKKELSFTKTGTVAARSSAPQFLFGPDGRLYWNFGNTGGKVSATRTASRSSTSPATPSNANGKPYRQGMVFRCDVDGSNFEMLGHNFRNNYEVAVDSFGTLWQSDNDDDGNHGVRINYVMEYGNFGYVDEMTGAGWQTNARTSETEMPLRHWHLNDPGVVPNLLQTGAGSPTGICVYEGNAAAEGLPEPGDPLRRRAEHRRAYPVTQGRRRLQGRDRSTCSSTATRRTTGSGPADVCVAPDGSLFVTDWYDPGVGGHQQRDLDRGRIFRVAPPKAKYAFAKLDLSTLDGAI